VEDERVDAFGMAVRAAGLVAVFGAITITHQLSPYIVFAGVACLWVLGVLRRPLVVLTLGIILVAYPLLHLAAVDQNQVLNGFSFSNLTGIRGFKVASPEQALGSNLAKLICLAFWGGTAICGLSYRRRLGVVAMPIILAAAPLSFALVSNYGGEAIFRAFLFSSPWCALVIAIRMADLVRAPRLRLTAMAFFALFVALGSAQSADFGQYPVLQVAQDEIRASTYFLDHAPLNATLVLAASNFPSRLNDKYVLHNATQTPNDPALDTFPKFEGNGLKRMTPRVLAQSVTNIANGSGYLVVAPSMYTEAAFDGDYAPGTLSALVPRLKVSPYWQVWYEHDGVVIFRAVPQGRTR
jgi:hypothetical protein